MTKDRLIFSSPVKRSFFCSVFLSFILVAHVGQSQCLWYPDTDHDGFGANVTGTDAPCGVVPAGYVSNHQDCNDKSANTAAWTPIVPDTNSGTIDPATNKIRIAPDGTPYILYRQYTGTDPRAPISVRKFNGTSWVAIGADPIGDYMQNADLVIDAAGMVYVSFLDQGNGNRVTVIKYDATNDTWNALGGRGFSPDPVAGPGRASIAVDNNNVPYVFYAEESTYAGFVMRYDQASGSWQNVGGGAMAQLGSQEYEMAIDGHGVPYVMFVEADSKISVMRFTGGAWQYVGAPSFSFGYVYSLKLALDANNVPYVAYMDGDLIELTVQRYDAGTGAWVKVGGAVYAGDAELSLAIDKFGAPYVAYADFNSFIITVVRWDGTSWQTMADAAFAKGTALSLAIAHENMPLLDYKVDGGDNANVVWIAPVTTAPDKPTLAATKTAICAGETSRLSVTGDLHDATAWKWYTDDSGFTPSVGSGAPLDVSPTGTKTYYARGEGSCTAAGDWSAVLTINVTTKPVAPTLSATKTSVCPSGSTTLSATGSLGNATNAQWVWYATTSCCAMADKVGTGASLPVTPSAQTTYYARGEGTCQGPEASVTIQVVALPVANSPAAITSICSGGPGTLTVTPVSNVSSYQWRVSSGSSWTDITGQTTATLTRAAGDLQTYPTENVYSVVLKNSIGCEQTLATNLKILSFPQPAIAGSGFPVPAAICAGNNASFSATTSSGANLEYQWQADNGGGFTDIVNGGIYADATTSSLKVNGAGAQVNGYQYRVTIRTLSGGHAVCNPVVTPAVALTVNTAPTVNTAGQPAATTVCAAGTAGFSVTAGGSSLTYQWQENSGSGFTDIANSSVYADATTANLRLTGVTAGMNSFTYRVRVANASCPAVTSNAGTLSVNVPPSIGGSGQPSNTSLCSGSDASFSVMAAGSNLSYQWQENSGTGFTNVINNAVYSGATGPTLRITAAAAALDGHKYRVTISSPGCSSATSDGLATLAVKNSAVTIVQEPVDASVCAGGSSGFEVTASGTNLGYQWQESTGGAFTDITNGGSYAGTTSAALIITGTTESMDGRTYRVVVTNVSCGTSAMSDGLATLTIATSGVDITADPLDVTTCQGENVTFQVSAEGSHLTYQWQESTDGISFEAITDGDGYTGATTGALVILAAAPLNGYHYRVMVGNGGCQSVTSGEAVLMVNTEPGEGGCPFVLLVSEGVSPNGDNVLDYWVIQGIERYPRNRVKIYNVWGDLIFERNGYVNDVQAWRGESNKGATLAGNHAPDGTYYYTIDLGDNNGKDSILKGFVLLKR